LPRFFVLGDRPSSRAICGSWRVGAAHREQGQAEVADPGERAMQRGLVGDRSAMMVRPAASLISCRLSNQADQRESRMPSTVIS
jgi:hypothetical protein